MKITHSSNSLLIITLERRVVHRFRWNSKFFSGWYFLVSKLGNTVNNLWVHSLGFLSHTFFISKMGDQSGWSFQFIKRCVYQRSLHLKKKNSLKSERPHTYVTSRTSFHTFIYSKYYTHPTAHICIIMCYRLC